MCFGATPRFVRNGLRLLATNVNPLTGLLEKLIWKAPLGDQRW